MSSSKTPCDSVAYYQFLYETGLKNQSHSFLHANYRMYLIGKGAGTLKTAVNTYDLKAGTLFFTFPHQSYEIEGNGSFIFFYITFNGADVPRLLDDHKISMDHAIYHDVNPLIKFWKTSIRRVTHMNAGKLTEGVLAYTLSFISDHKPSEASMQIDRFERIRAYIDCHYTQLDLSLKRIAEIFLYDEKYLSALFKRRTGVKFTDYLNDLRIRHALTLIKEGRTSVSEIAVKSGYQDPFYFSRVFKKLIKKSPTEYIKSLLKVPEYFPKETFKR